MILQDDDDPDPKERVWRSVVDPTFASTFCRFRSCRHPPDLLPFRMLFLMHDVRRRVVHYLHQFLKIALVLRLAFGIHDHTWTLDNLSLKRTERQKTFLFVLGRDDGTSLPLCMPCPEGYHIVISGFENCHVENQRYPLTEVMTTMTSKPYRLLARQIRRAVQPMDDGWLDAFLGHLETYRRTFLRRLPPSGLDVDVWRRLLPLVEVVPLDANEDMSSKTIRDGIRRMEKVFEKEFGTLTSKFKDTVRVMRMLEDWVKVLARYKEAFMDDPEGAMSRIRKELYQYLVDCKYNHVSFEGLDVSRMTVSLYGWAHLLERWLSLRDASSSWSDSNEELKWIGCLETLLDEVNADDVTFEGEVCGMDFSSSSSSFRVWRFPDDARHRLVQTHPLLRSDVMCQMDVRIDK